MRHDLWLEPLELVEEAPLGEGAVDDEDGGREGVARVLVKEPVLVLLHHLKLIQNGIEVISFSGSYAGNVFTKFNFFTYRGRRKIASQDRHST